MMGWWEEVVKKMIGSGKRVKENDLRVGERMKYSRVGKEREKKR
jgi:hypothetical protein